MIDDDAEIHRPRTRIEFLRAVAEQRALKLKAGDIAAAFGLTTAAVRGMFYELDHGGQPQFGTNTHARREREEQ
jgi:hypothetical protein